MAWPSITEYSNGEAVEAVVLNKPIQQLATRTQHLLDAISALRGGTTYVDGRLHPGTDGKRPVVGDVVYRRAEDGSYARALARTENNDVFYAAPEAMAVGVVASVEQGGETGKIVLSGCLSLPVPASDLLEDGSSLPAGSGRCYLSARNPGRVTPTPSGPVIYVGDYHADGNACSILVNPQYRDTGESHVHRAFVLTGKPRGPLTLNAAWTEITAIGEYQASGSSTYDASGWTLSSQDGRPVLRLDLRRHPEVARFLPLIPGNSVSLQIDGVEARSRELFGDDGEWSIERDSESTWLVWHSVSLDGAVLPFSVDATKAPTPHHIVLYAAKALVGPTGFVTSLDVIPGSPLRIVSRSSAMTAHQGDLQIGLDVDFSTSNAGEPGFNVLKRVDGNRFIAGPVVERISCGAGLSMISRGGPDGQGEVELSVGGAAYTGDFETIALENAKQALVGGFFPYTRLLGWTSGAANVNTAFTAKFRVPDSIPDASDNGYNVVLSMSVFGEEDAASASAAGVHLTSGVLPDFSSSGQSASFSGGVRKGQPAVVDIPFASGYVAYDPIFVHGFTGREDDAQHVTRAALTLKDADGYPIVVHPGWFVGVRIARGATQTPSAYTGPLGVVSLRWELVAAGQGGL